VIIDAVVFGMIDVPELRRLLRVARFDFWIAVAAIVGVLSAGVLAGVVVGVALSLGWLVYVATQPPMPLLGREPGTRCSATWRESRRRDVTRHRCLRLDGGLFFATAEALENGSAGSSRTERYEALVPGPRGRQLRRLSGVAKLAEITSSSRRATSRSGLLVSSLRCCLF
jgi:MFS superfamily sulfate permease-like transporter